jgi:bacillithiol biosynthesis deacetylase BshB1
MKLDILVLAAHPDDAELACSGTLLSHAEQGKKVGIVDLTLGELGTRGTVEIRRREALDSAQILGLSVRRNLELADGFFQNDRTHQLKVASAIRYYQPEIILTNAVSDRHPDHSRAAALVKDACFIAGLRKVETQDGEGHFQEPWRPNRLYHFIQDQYLVPDLIVDITPFWARKVAAIQAFSSQFYNPESNEPATYISSQGFMDSITSRAMEMGHYIGVQYAEGFTKVRHIGVKSLFDLIS